MIPTRLTRDLGLTHPVISAPMAGAAGGALAAAVSRSGGLGLIGGGYGDPDWIADQIAAAGNTAVGCGLITWKLAETPEVLTQVLAHRPRALCLSFGDPTPFADQIRDSGSALICQVQSRLDATLALAAEADVIVAQGTEAGGHGGRRATLSLVPEIADLVADQAPGTLVVAAGGIADGRGLAAALMLGADGVMIGSRLWASTEALVPDGMIDAAVQANGDATLRTRSVDVVRGLDWPAPYDIRVLRSQFTDRWHDNLDGLRAGMMTEAKKWQEAVRNGDARAGNAVVGEAVGLIHERQPARQIIETMVKDAEHLLGGGWRYDGS